MALVSTLSGTTSQARAVGKIEKLFLKPAFDSMREVPLKQGSLFSRIGLLETLVVLSLVYFLVCGLQFVVEGQVDWRSSALVETTVAWVVFAAALIVAHVFSLVLHGVELAYPRLLVGVAVRTGLPVVALVGLHLVWMEGFLDRRLGVVLVFYLISLSLCVATALSQIRSESASTE